MESHPQSARSQALRILLIDDDPVLAELLPALFAAVGHAVTTAGSGEEALALLRQGQDCDVLLTDLHLPGLSGCALAAELATARPPQALLLGMSGSEPSRAELDLLDAFLPKPFGLHEFAAALDHARARHRLRGFLAATETAHLPDERSPVHVFLR
jgi:CheY-like chemotaxis protein